MRLALYARYSSDRQKDTSIEDQLRLCRERAAALDGTIVATYSDAAISGAHLMNRPGVQQLLSDAKAGRIDAVLAEALDRLSRSQRDVAELFERLAYSDVKILTLAEGEVSELHVGLKGTMNALYLKDLAQRVRRGQRGRTEAGYSAGGLPYGYRVVREIGADGELVRGKREIDPDQAAVVRRIFEEYAKGRSPRAIAKDLNRDAIPGPRGGAWGATSVYGHTGRRNGIICGEIYAGFLVYNRQRFVKDPDTGRRVPRMNPPEDWTVTEVPELAIVSRDLWDRVQALRQQRARQPMAKRKRPTRPLSGLLRCGVCGGAYTIVDMGRYGCSAHRQKGTCDNARRVKSEELERRVFEGLKVRMLSPEAIEAFVASYHRTRKARRQARAAAADRHTAELRELTPKIERIVDAICEGEATPAMRERLQQMEARKAEIEAELDQARAAEADDNVVQLHPGLADAYRQRVGELQQALKAEETRDEAAQILRGLINAVVVYPKKGGGVELKLGGRLAQIIALARGEPGEGEIVLPMVAGDRYQRYYDAPILEIFV